MSKVNIPELETYLFNSRRNCFSLEMKEQKFGREKVGQEEKNSMKKRYKEQKVREEELTQDCTKHRHKHMCVVAMFCFLNQPDHRTCSVTDDCKIAGGHRGCR